MIWPGPVKHGLWLTDGRFVLRLARLENVLELVERSDLAEHCVMSEKRLGTPRCTQDLPATEGLARAG